MAIIRDWPGAGDVVLIEPIHKKPAEVCAVLLGGTAHGLWYQGPGEGTLEVSRGGDFRPRIYRRVDRDGFTFYTADQPDHIRVIYAVDYFWENGRWPY